MATLQLQLEKKSTHFTMWIQWARDTRWIARHFEQVTGQRPARLKKKNQKNHNPQLAFWHSYWWNTPNNNTKLSAGQWKYHTTTTGSLTTMLQLQDWFNDSTPTPIQLNSCNTQTAASLAFNTFTHAHLPTSDKRADVNRQQRGDFQPGKV